MRYLKSILLLSLCISISAYILSKYEVVTIGKYLVANALFVHNSNRILEEYRQIQDSSSVPEHIDEIKEREKRNIWLGPQLILAIKFLHHWNRKYNRYFGKKWGR